MSEIINLGMSPIVYAEQTPFSFISSLNKFATISEDILFGPGMVTRFAESFFKILEIADEHFYENRIQQEMNGSFASFLLHPLSKSQSARYFSSKNEEQSQPSSLNQTPEVSKIENSDSETDPFSCSPAALNASSLTHLFRRKEETLRE